MNNERIDVLAVLDKHVESHMRMALSDAYSAQEYPKLREARAAVAELIEAAQDVQMNRFHENPDERDRSLGRLEAALARVGGAA